MAATALSAFSRRVGDFSDKEFRQQGTRAQAAELEHKLFRGLGWPFATGTALAYAAAVSEGQVAVAVVFFVLAALLVGGLGLYYVGGFPILAEWWERAKSGWIAMNARIDERQAAPQRAAERGIEIGLSPSEALDRAVENMTPRGCGLENRIDNTGTFARHQRADTATGCVLMLFFLLPGILYLALASKTVRLTVAAYPEERGSRLVIGGDDWTMIRATEQWARSLPDPSEWRPGPLAPEPTYAESASSAPTLPQRLRELAESKDAGLITQEEYEAKKKELLDRM